MFKFKSYNVKKESAKDEKEGAKASFKTSSSSSSSSSSPTGTLRKNPKTKEKPSAEEIRHANNKSSPQYEKKTTKGWHENKVYSAKSETKKVVIPTPHKKLERK